MVVTRWEVGVKAGLEIERVWLLRGLPPLPSSHDIWKIDQGYLAGADGSAMGRLRRTVLLDGREQFHINHKRGAGLVREESEGEISLETFQSHWPNTAGRRVTKKRHRVAVDGLVWEIDEFSDFPLVLAEVELPCAQYACAIPIWLSPWIVREVTEDSRYRNFNLATRGPPDSTITG